MLHDCENAKTFGAIGFDPATYDFRLDKPNVKFVGVKIRKAERVTSIIPRDKIN